MTKEQRFQVTRWVIFIVIGLSALIPLLVEPPAPVKLTDADLLEWKALATKLHEQGQREPPSPGKRIWENLSPDLRPRLAHPDESLKMDLLDGLNALLSKKELYHEESWKGITLDASASELLAKGLEALEEKEVQRLNRNLIDVAFPREVRKRRFLPAYSSKVVKDLYDQIDGLAPRSPVLISFDFDPGSEAELMPMANAILRQSFRKNLRVIAISLYSVQSVPLMSEIVRGMATDPEFAGSVQEGRDFVLAGYSPGAAATILASGQDFYLSFKEDPKHVPLKGQEAMKGIGNLKDIPLVITLSAGSLPDTWIAYGQDRFRFKLGLGCTAVMATDYYPRLQAKQLCGLVGGLAGAYQYESLVNAPARATEAMKPQSVIHLVIVLLIVIGNVMYFVSRRSK